MTGVDPARPARAATRFARALRTLLPSARDYRDVKRTWRGDLVAGVTVGIVALPLALGFGISSGLTAEAGLVTAIVAGVLAAVFGGSNVQVSGPTGAMVVVLGPIVASHGAGAVAAISILAGAIVLAAGALRLGRAVSFIPWPVIEGFTLGIAVIIFLQQVPLLMSPTPSGVGEHSSNSVIAAIQSVAGADGAYVPWAVGAAAIVVACMVAAPRIHPAVPGSLIGIAIATVLAVVLPTPLAVIGVLPTVLPMPSFPAVDLETLGDLAVPSFTIAALAAVESLLSARVAASLADTGPLDPDRELVGQGVASIGSAMFGGMPATGAIARTAVNVRSGGRSRLSSIVHALVLLCVVLLAAGPVGQIPLAALAGVLMLTAVRMVDVGTVRSILRSTRGDAAAFLLTALVTVSFDLIVAVAIGMVFAGVFALRRLAAATAVHVEEPPGRAEPEDVHIAIVCVEGPLFFATADKVFDAVTGLSDPTVVVLRMSRLELVDATGARVLTDIVHTLERRGVTVLIKGVQPGHEELFRTVGVLDSLRHHRHLFDELPDAVAHARSHVRRQFGAHTT